MSKIAFFSQPNYSNLILWGQRNLRGMVQIDDHIKALEPSFCLGKLDVTLSSLGEDNQKILCAEINGKWVRAKPIATALDRDGLLEIDCIDIGIKQFVPLFFLRAIPQDEHFLRSTPPLAARYMLADVVVDKNLKAKNSVMQ